MRNGHPKLGSEAEHEARVGLREVNVLVGVEVGGVAPHKSPEALDLGTYFLFEQRFVANMLVDEPPTPRRMNPLLEVDVQTGGERRDVLGEVLPAPPRAIGP